MCVWICDSEVVCGECTRYISWDTAYTKNREQNTNNRLAEDSSSHPWIAWGRGRKRHEQSARAVHKMVT